VSFDEEPSDLGVVSECLMRIADHEGRILLAMTPLMGWTTLLKKHVRKPPADTVVRWLHGKDNPHVSAEFLEKLYRKFGPLERAARERGEIVALEGRIFESWSRALHVVPSFIPPEHWPRFGSIDFGTRNPFCFLASAMDEADNTLHIYGCHYQAGWTISQHVPAIHEAIGVAGPPHPLDPSKSPTEEAECEIIWADPEDASARLTLVSEHGIPTMPALKAVRDGLNAVAERLAPDVRGKVHLVVHDCCVPVIEEIEGYRWDPVRSKSDEPDRPLKRNDHAMDALRYLCMGIARVYLVIGGSDDDIRAKR
jgi:phage terminase large subunit